MTWRPLSNQLNVLTPFSSRQTISLSMIAHTLRFGRTNFGLSEPHGFASVSCMGVGSRKRQGFAESMAASETTRYSYDLPFALNFILSLLSVNSIGVLMGIKALPEGLSCLMW